MVEQVLKKSTKNEKMTSLNMSVAIRGFGQKVRCGWRNKELTPKGEDVITRRKYVLDTIG